MKWTLRPASIPPPPPPPPPRSQTRKFALNSKRQNRTKSTLYFHGNTSNFSLVKSTGHTALDIANHCTHLVLFVLLSVKARSFGVCEAPADMSEMPDDIIECGDGSLVGVCTEYAKNTEEEKRQDDVAHWSMNWASPICSTNASVLDV